MAYEEDIRFRAPRGTMELLDEQASELDIPVSEYLRRLVTPAVLGNLSVRAIVAMKREEEATPCP